MKILLTGGNGMVGRSILAHPGFRGYQIIAPNRSELDLMDNEAVGRYIRQQKPDFVIHAAGRVGGIQANISAPVQFLHQNLQMGINVVLAARSYGVPQLLNLASTCMYPKDAEGVLTEDMILSGALEPTNEGYALAKIAIVRLCQYVSAEAGLDYKSLVPCNLYGPYDKFDPANSHLIPAVIHKVHAAKIDHCDTVEIWGDGTARREFMFVGDLAGFVADASSRMRELPQIMNVGLGTDYSVLEYYQAVAGVVGWEGQFAFNLSKPVGMQRKLSSVTRMKQFGWTASTSLRDGIRQTYEFFLSEIGS